MQDDFLAVQFDKNHWSKIIVDGFLQLRFSGEPITMEMNKVISALNNIKDQSIILPYKDKLITIKFVDNVGTSQFGGPVTPDDQGQSQLCVAFSLGKAITEGL